MRYGFRTKEYIENLNKLEYLHEEDPYADIPVKVDCSFGVSPFGPPPGLDLSRIASGISMDSYPRFPYDELRDALCAYWKDIYPLRKGAREDKDTQRPGAPDPDIRLAEGESWLNRLKDNARQQSCFHGIID